MAFFDDLGRFGEAPALVAEDGASLSYASLADRADAFGQAIRRRGLVFLLARNCPESVIGYLGCLRSRNPALLLSSSLHRDLLASLRETYGPQYVWAPRERAAEIPGGREILAVCDYVLLATGTPAPELHRDLALLVTTSGTTGSRKLVRQSHENLASNTESIAEYLRIDETDRPVTTLPMNYVYGLSVINSHLLRGAAIVLTERGLMQKPFWELLRSREVTSLSGVPYTYEMLRRLGFHKMELATLKVLTQAGGKLSSSMVEEFASLCADRSIRFYVMYGAAEATARMAYLPPEHALQKSSSIGVPIPGGELWLEDDRGCAIHRSGITGELVYRGKNVSLGYATCREDLGLGDERSGVLRTGDMAFRDDEGFYHVVGRRSRFIKVFGNRVNLQDLELIVHAAGIECACAGEDDRLQIYIVEAAARDKVIKFVEERTGLHRSAFRVLVVDQIPRNESGKVAYAALG